MEIRFACLWKNFSKVTKKLFLLTEVAGCICVLYQYISLIISCSHFLNWMCVNLISYIGVYNSIENHDLILLGMQKEDTAKVGLVSRNLSNLHEILWRCRRDFQKSPGSAPGNIQRISSVIEILYKKHINRLILTTNFVDD